MLKLLNDLLFINNMGFNYLFEYVFWFLGQSSAFLQRNISTGRLWDSSHDSVAADVLHSTADSTDMDEEQPQAHQGQCMLGGGYNRNVEDKM